jgi:hypothetical protein
MQINSNSQYPQRSGGIFTKKVPYEVMRERLKNVKLTEEDWQDIARQMNAPKPEPAIQKKGMVQSVVDTIKNMWPKPKPFKLSDHDKDFSVSIDA